MIKMNTIKLLIVMIAVYLLFAFNYGMTQTGNDKIKSIYFDNIVRLAVEALNDSSINIALCEVPDNPYHSVVEPVFDSIGGVEHYSVTSITGLKSIELRDQLRGSANMDSLIILESLLINHTGPMETQYPLVNLYPRSKWIIFFYGPYLKGRKDHDSAMEKSDECEENLKGQVDLNFNNYFTVYENACAFCTYFPEGAKYPPMFIFSSDLVDDFKTIIKLQDNPPLLSESSNSYENYYDSMKDEFGKRVFSRLFENPNQE